VAGKEPAAGKMPPNRVRKPHAPHRRQILKRKPRGSARPPVAILLPGLCACKEELLAWAAAVVARGMAARTIDGPSRDIVSSSDYPRMGRVISAVIDVLEQPYDVNAWRSGWWGRVLATYTLRSLRPAATKGVHRQLRPV
jgi:hypothetical protein